MFKRLHIRLTLFCTFISGLILLLMSLICLSFSEAEARESYFSNFELKAAMLIHQSESQSVLSLEWFSQLKADTKFEMDIQDNGTKLIFEDLSPQRLDPKIFALARKTARDEYGLTEESVTSDTKLSSNASFELHTDGKNTMPVSH